MKREPREAAGWFSVFSSVNGDGLAWLTLVVRRRQYHASSSAHNLGHHGDRGGRRRGFLCPRHQRTTAGWSRGRARWHRDVHCSGVQLECRAIHDQLCLPETGRRVGAVLLRPPGHLLGPQSGLARH